MSTGRPPLIRRDASCSVETETTATTKPTIYAAPRVEYAPALVPCESRSRCSSPTAKREEQSFRHTSSSAAPTGSIGTDDSTATLEVRSSCPVLTWQFLGVARDASDVATFDAFRLLLSESFGRVKSSRAEHLQLTSDGGGGSRPESIERFTEGIADNVNAALKRVFVTQTEGNDPGTCMGDRLTVECMSFDKFTAKKRDEENRLYEIRKEGDEVYPELWTEFICPHLAILSPDIMCTPTSEPDFFEQHADAGSA